MSPVVVGEPKPRPSWDEYALGIAFAVAKRADCSRRQVGAVVMGPDHRILGTGYNGYPAGAPGCASANGCPRGRLSYEQVGASSSYTSGAGVCAALHAEENAVLHLDRHARIGATIYVTDEPCPNCQRFLSGSGVARVVWPDGEIAF